MTQYNEEYRNSEDSLGEILCRICYTADNKKYVRPCKCKGTIGLVHAECLEQWLVETGRNTCELCGASYVTERELRYSAEHSLFIWFLTRHRQNFVHLNFVRLLRTDVIISSILTIVVLAANFFCVHGADLYCIALKRDWPSTNKWTSLALFLILAVLTAGYYAWMIVAVKYHIHKWYWWWQHSLTVKLIADAVDVEEYRKELHNSKNKDKQTASSRRDSENPVINNANTASRSNFQQTNGNVTGHSTTSPSNKK